MRIYNGEDMEITIVTDGNADVVIPPKTMLEVDVPDGAYFNTDSFYVQEDGQWYGEDTLGTTGAHLEIYNAN